MNVKKLTGIALATAAAAVFTTVPVTSVVASDGVNCYGINGCKGQGSCNTPTSKCNGTNSCKGKGVLAVKSKAECKAKGGTVVE